MVLERPDFLRRHLSQAEVLEDGLLRLRIHAPVAAVGLGNPQLAAIECGDHLLDTFCVHRTSSRISAARWHSASVGTSASRQ